MYQAGVKNFATHAHMCVGSTTVMWNIVHYTGNSIIMILLFWSLKIGPAVQKLWKFAWISWNIPTFEPVDGFSNFKNIKLSIEFPSHLPYFWNFKIAKTCAAEDLHIIDSGSPVNLLKLYFGDTIVSCRCKFFWYPSLGYIHCIFFNHVDSWFFCCSNLLRGHMRFYL